MFIAASIFATQIHGRSARVSWHSRQTITKISFQPMMRRSITVL
jgi:hypothetical protein